MSPKRSRKPAGYSFDEHSFPTKQATIAAIQFLLNSQPLGEPLAPAHLQFMLAVLENHPSAEIKIGCGVASMEVRINTRHRNNRNFWIIRHDGTGTDFSFLECLHPANQAQKVRSACREAISDQLADFKRRWYREYADAAGCVTCPVLQILVPWDAGHVDHQAPNTLAALVDAFLASKRLSADDIALRGSEDGMTGALLSDEALAQEWADYHRANAVLRVVSKQANLGTLRRIEFRERR